MADSFHSARMSKLCLAHQRRKDAEREVSFLKLSIQTQRLRSFLFNKIDGFEIARVGPDQTISTLRLCVSASKKSID